MPPQRLAALCRHTGRLALRTQQGGAARATAAAATTAARWTTTTTAAATAAPRTLYRSFSASAARPVADGETVPAPASQANAEALRHLELLSQGLAPFDEQTDGHRFGLTMAETRPTMAVPGADGAVPELPVIGKLQSRYDPVVAQLTRLLMRDGKLAKAESNMAVVLNYLRQSPPPKISPATPLLPHPPAALLPLDPVRYLTLAVESLGPLIRIVQYQGIAGGGAALPVPIPLAARQRRRQAFVWIVEQAMKKPSRGSGRFLLAQSIGEEIVAVVEGRSSLWERRLLLHKQATSARTNVRRVSL